MGPERGILKIKPLKGCYLNSKLCYGVYICFYGVVVATVLLAAFSIIIPPSTVLKPGSMSISDDLTR